MSSTAPNVPYFGVTEAAEEIGITPSRLRQMLRAGIAKGEKVAPRAWLLARKEVDRLKKTPSKRGRPRRGAA